ncbi:DUF3892 domain-containing protein [Pseudactinotalea sp. Z1748]|uniref:DUF3892 domain-containing protein n=1 Tax=Pseudactinotalea sp. Z1748 TaxID=3413027 RepID=UPI003C7A6BF9
MIYIRRVRVSDPGMHSTQIAAVQYSFATTGALWLMTREQAVRHIVSGKGCRSHNDTTRQQAEVVVRQSASGVPYITTAADGVETNNLLALPRF